jgi:hypothetical protein
LEEDKLMATLINPLTESASLTEKEYVLVPPYSEESGAVTEYRTEARFTLPQVRKIPDWVQPTVEALVRIMRLPPNWDSFGAQPVQSALAGKAVEILSLIMEENSPPPSIVPLSDGGLQMEWHLRGEDVEIVVATDEPTTYYYRGREGNSEDGFPSAAYARLRSIIQELG